MYNRATVGYLGSAMNRVYNYMFIGVIITGIVAYLVSTLPSVQALVLTSPLKWLVIFAPLACVLFMSFRFDKMSEGTLAALFGIVTMTFGASLSTIFMTYTSGSIWMALFSASSVFLVMSFYGYFTKKDLSGWGKFLFIGLIALIISQIANIFIGSSPLDMALSACAVLIFTALTAYDTQRIKEMMLSASTDQVNKLAIMGALTLYLDFINLFIHLLNLFGNRR